MKILLYSHWTAVLFVACWCHLTPIQAQSVNRIQVKDYAEDLEVTYQLKSDRPLTVQLFYSEDDGGSWKGPLKSVTGDVGRGVTSGKKKIVWNFAEEVKELYGERFRFKVRTGEHFGFSMKFRNSWFNIPSLITEDMGQDKDLAAYRLRQVAGWNSIEDKAPSGNYDFEMHHELNGVRVDSRVELLGHRCRSAVVGMLFSAVLPGSGIPYVTYGDAKRWNVEANNRRSKKGSGNFWSIAIFGGAAVLLHGIENQVFNEEINRTFGTQASAEEAAEPYRYAKWSSAGLAGLIYTLQVGKVIKWNKVHKTDMSNFVSDWP